jgi:hypothetical protein
VITAVVKLYRQPTMVNGICADNRWPPFYHIEIGRNLAYPPVNQYDNDTLDDALDTMFRELIRSGQAVHFKLPGTKS